LPNERKEFRVIIFEKSNFKNIAWQTTNCQAMLIPDFTVSVSTRKLVDNGWKD